jgi:hypothetical protein
MFLEDVFQLLSIDGKVEIVCNNCGAVITCYDVDDIWCECQGVKNANDK